MSFLPEDDQDFLREKELEHCLETEQLPDGQIRRGIVFPKFEFEGNLHADDNGKLSSCNRCALMILIPTGYATTKLDSFYTSPRLKHTDATEPDRANGNNTIFKRPWQFWSRHLTDAEWRVGVDGLQTYLQYVRGELRKA